MNIREEKRYVYEMMREVTMERRQLTDIYFQLKKRLEELDELEIRGLEELSIKGFVELQNGKDKELKASNIQRELEVVKDKLINNEEDESHIPHVEIDKTKKSGPKKIISLEKCESYIIEILKDKGTPVKADVLYEEFSKRAEDIGYVKKTNFKTNILPRLAQKNDKISRPIRGMYQYIL